VSDFYAHEIFEFKYHALAALSNNMDVNDKWFEHKI